MIIGTQSLNPNNHIMLFVFPIWKEMLFVYKFRFLW